MSEISDKSIMAATQVEAQPSSGRIRFVTKLPSGKELSSEWIQESDKTKGVLRWCEAVRTAVGEEQVEAEADRKKRVLASRDARAVAAQPGFQGLSASLPPTLASLNTPAGQSSMSDPAAFLTQAVQNAEQAEAHWRAAAATATANWQAALADLQKWKQIATSLNLQTTPTTPTPTPTTPGPTSASDPIIETIDFDEEDES